MNITQKISSQIAAALNDWYDGDAIDEKDILVTPTRAEFEGDYSVVVFPFVKRARCKPEDLASKLGDEIENSISEVSSFNVIKGFLNISLSEEYWKNFLFSIGENNHFEKQQPKGEKVMVEFASPNTNKPLHLGHIRNILLGWSMSQILDFAGFDVIKTQIVNDRGIAICRSMLAWQLFADGQTPEGAGVKGDHFVGSYYVKFARAFSEEYEQWQQTDEAAEVYADKGEGKEKSSFFKDYKNDYFNNNSKLGAQAIELLRKWEDGDPSVRALWQRMNSWVYKGYEETYQTLQVDFDKLYYESQTYLLGKEIIREGLEKGLFNQDGKRIWIDLEDSKLGIKTILKSDGTSTYTSQDLGTAQQRFEDFGATRMVYVVANEQDHHFQVLFEILKRLEEPYAYGLHHLSYGMVDLPSGRMKSREGTVVDADDLMMEVIEAAKQESSERAEVDGQDENTHIKVGMAALKYYILKVNAKKRITFDPEKSVELQGQTGPYIQYNYVRINGILQRGETEGIDMSTAVSYSDLQAAEMELLRQLHEFRSVVMLSANEMDPSHIANYAYALAKSYSRFWHDLSIFGEVDEAVIAFRLTLSEAVGEAIKQSMHLLGVEMPERM